MKKHLLGFLYFLIMWIVGSVILDIVLSPALSRYTGVIGFVLGIYVWYRVVKTEKTREVA
jgi:hypothetical protein